MKTENKNLVAETILEQLGGSRFIAMTGTKDFACDANFLQFRVGRNTGGYKGVKIELDNMDLYKVTFWKMNRKYEVTNNIFHGIYADQLQALFTEQTGLNTSL